MDGTSEGRETIYQIQISSRNPKVSKYLPSEAKNNSNNIRSSLFRSALPHHRKIHARVWPLHQFCRSTGNPDHINTDKALPHPVSRCTWWRAAGAGWLTWPPPRPCWPRPGRRGWRPRPCPRPGGGSVVRGWGTDTSSSRVRVICTVELSVKPSRSFYSAPGYNLL